MGRSIKFDLFRGISALMVLLYHYSFRYFEIFYNGKSFQTFKYGFLGVPVFFILSGLLISKSLQKDSNLIHYFSKRFFRIYPTYIVCMLCTFLVTKFLFITVRTVTYGDFILNFFVISDYLGGKYVDSSYWSLAIEILFYILAPLLISFRSLFIGLIILSFSNTFLSFYIFNVFTLFNWVNFFYLGYLLLNKSVVKKINILEYGLVFLNVYLHFGLSYLFTSIFFVVFYFINLKIELPSYFIRIIRFLADVSFPLYLLHQNIGYFLINFFVLKLSIPYMFSILIIIFILYTLAYIVHITIEKKYQIFNVK